MMDVFNFCWVTLLTESKDHSVFLDKDTCKVVNEYDEEFDKPIKRISFWYKYAGFNISFFHHCLRNCFESVPESRKVIEQVCTLKNLNICSLSTGPGSYVVGFLYSLHLLGIPLSKTVNFKFITKHVHWRNLVKQMLNSGTVNVPESSSFKLIQCDILTELSAKSESYIKIADVLFMCNTFSSPRANKDVTLSVLKDILQLLKPGALVFFIANEETSSYLKEYKMFGYFLYGPISTTIENIPYDKKIAEWIGAIPKDSGSSYFAVWQKFACIQEETSSPVKLINMTPFDEVIGDFNEKNAKTTNSSIVSNVSTFKQFPFNLQSSSTNLSCTALNATTHNNNTPILTKNDVSFASKFKERIDVQTNRSDLFYSKKEYCAQSVQTDTSSMNQEIGSSNGNSTKAESSLKSLIKTVESLVTNLDEFVRSQNTFRRTSDQKGSTCAGHLPNLGHTEKVCQPHNCKGCACNQLNSCCMMSRNSHCCNGFMSLNHHQNVASTVPHLVVPLHNLTEQTLTKVLSLVSTTKGQ